MTNQRIEATSPPEITPPVDMKGSVDVFVKSTAKSILTLYTEPDPGKVKTRVEKTVFPASLAKSTLKISGALPQSSLIAGIPAISAELKIDFADYLSQENVEADLETGGIDKLSTIKTLNTFNTIEEEEKKTQIKLIVNDVTNVSIAYQTTAGDSITYSFEPVEGTSWECYVTVNGKLCVVGTRADDPFQDLQFDEEMLGRVRLDTRGIFEGFSGGNVTV